MRSDLTMGSAFNYNAAQKERILQDPDHSVQIGLLRRKDVQFTDAQVARGINHPDEDLAFSYQQVKGYVPTAEQIEIGLTSSNAPTRVGWALNESITITSSQAQCGIADTAEYIVAIFLERKNVPTVDLNPYFEKSLRSALESTLLAMAANNALPLAKEQLKRVPLALTSPQVKQAFARR